LVEWYHQDRDGAVHDSGRVDISEVNIMIQLESWELYKTLKKQWFNPMEGGMTEK
jgi:hypothetical protein